MGEATINDVESRLDERIESLSAGIRDGTITAIVTPDEDSLDDEDHKDVLLELTSTMSSMCRDVETLQSQHRESSSSLELVRNQQVWSMQELSHLADGMKD